MAGEFLTGLTLGSDVGSKIADRRRQRRFEDALASGDVQQAGLIDPQRLQQQQSLEAQRQEAQTAESTIRQQAALRAAQAIRNLAPRLGGDYRAAADMVVSKSGGLFGSPEELAGAVEFIGQNGEEGLAAIEASFGAPQKATQPVRPFEMSQDGRNVLATYGPDGSIQILGDAPQKAAAERNPLDDEYRRSQIEANKALAEQRRQPKAGAAAGGTEQAREGVSQVLSEIGAAFNTLQQSNGVVVPGGDFRQNAVARLRSSGPGQVFGGTVGTQDQSVRERINNSRPLLINAIRQATGMSAKALDSNAELKFYLQAATDPTKDLYSNLAAIDALDRLYGLGGALDAVVPPEVLIEVRSQTGGAAPAAAVEAPVFDDAKRARLEELRRKRDAGTLR